MKKINRKGLTMVELLAVVVIIGILASMSIIAYTKYINSAKIDASINTSLSIIEWNLKYVLKRLIWENLI